MLKQLDYLGNAQIIGAVSELPKIGDPRPYFEDSKCISVEAYEDDRAENYLFYRVKYVQGGRFLDLGYMCFTFSYCILKSEV